MERINIITQLGVLANKYKSVKIYLFGSFLNISAYKDIDILLIYQNYSTLYTLKNKITTEFHCELIHFTCLTLNEELELKFIDKINAVEIKSQTINKILNEIRCQI